MTILEQRYYESVPSRLHGLETEIKNLNTNINRILSLIESKGSVTQSTLEDIMLSEEPITNSMTAATYLKDNLNGLDHEEVWTLLLTSDMKPIRKVLVNIGNLHETCIDTRRITRAAMESNAAALVLFHNHPSGNQQPSRADIQRTEELRDALKLFDITLVDHIIFGGKGNYYSFADEKEQTITKKNQNNGKH